MLKPRTLLIALALFGHPLLCPACGNEYFTAAEMPLQAKGLNLRHLLHYPGDTQLPYWSHGFGENIVGRRNTLFRQITGKRHAIGPVPWRELERALEKNVDYRLLSDFAWYELRVGSKQHAVRLLERLYEKYPDEYNVVANLGTAYEVTGKNEQALTLLKKAVAINPASHHGSEWIHVNILEQKIKESPDYTLILDLGSGKDYPGWLTGKMYHRQITPDSLMVQLAYQLHERISFIARPDPVVGQLVLDFADLAAIAYSGEEAKEFYEYAVYYDPALAATANQRMQGPAAKNGEITTRRMTEKRPSGFQWWYVIAPVLLAGTGAWFVLRRKKISGQ